MKKLTSLLLLLFAGSAPAWAECFDEHIREAIQTNQSRLRTYQRLSGGRTESLSKELIGMERDALMFAKWYMARTRSWREAGVPLFCTEFLPMSRAQELIQAPKLDRPQLRSYREPQWRAFHRSVSSTLEKMEETLRSPIPEAMGILWWDLQNSIEEELGGLSDEKRFNCMYRHMVESMWLVSKEAVSHAKKSRELSIESSESWSISLLKLHLQVLSRTVSLDRRAAPVQADGIPFLCSDVPHL